MRRKLAFILLGILCVTGAGCGDGARPAAPSDVDIPETIHILYDVEKITAPEEACVYSVISCGNIFCGIRQRKKG